MSSITERLEAIEQALKRIEGALGIGSEQRTDVASIYGTKDDLRWPHLPPHSPANTLPDVGKA